MSDDQQWKPDTEAMIKQLIRTTLQSSDSVKPEDLPHILRRQLQGQVDGSLDIDDHIKQVLASMKKKGEL